ncbi:MAG: DUF4159 domain-containing protein [Candidatus Zixiibacteriota bacterium]
MSRFLKIIGYSCSLALVVGLGWMASASQSAAQTRLTAPANQNNEPLVDPSVFTVARLHYPGGGDWYWGSSALPNLLEFISQETGIPVNNSEIRVRPGEDRLFDYPFIFATGHGTIRFSDEDIVRMRRYLTGGGFWLINDSYGMKESVRRELKRIFPDRELVELPFSHPIYHTPFEFPDGPPKIHEHDNQPARGYAILDGDRVVVYFVVESDIGDGWEDPQVHKDPPAKREAALRMGANIAVYALTH